MLPLNQVTTYVEFGKIIIIILFLSQWPTGLTHVLSSAARTLGSWIRVPLEAWMCVRVFLCCVVLCRYRPCVGLIPVQGFLPTAQID
jgi:hypothetical protein